MISLEESIPQKSDTFFRNLDVFYTQFNNVNFYIEDADQENFYYVILGKLFPKVKLTKIFPLNGKANVLLEASRYINSRNKIFIVDKDFDDILHKLISQPNLFYLDRYSIENFLVEQHAFTDFIISESPKTKISNIKLLFKTDDYKKKCFKTFYKITLLYLLIQYKNLPITNSSISPERFFDFSSIPAPRSIEIEKYKNQIEQQLKVIDKRFTLVAQLRRMIKLFNLNNYIDCAHHIPGKYIIRYFKRVIEHIFDLPKSSIDSFNYKVAKNCSFDSLAHFRNQVNSYLSH